MKVADLMKEFRCSTLLGECAAQMQSLRRNVHKQRAKFIVQNEMEMDSLCFNMEAVGL